MENDARGRKFTAVSTLGAQGPGHSKRRHGPRRDKQSGHELIIGVGSINH